MDRNQTVGIILMSVLIITYVWLFSNNKEMPQEDVVTTKQTEQLDQQVEEQTTGKSKAAQISDSLYQEEMSEKFGLFGSAMKGKASKVQIENDLVVIDFNSRGGVVTRVELKEFKTFDDQALLLLDEQNNKINQLIETRSGQINLSDLFYTATSKTHKVEMGDSTVVSFTAVLDSGVQIVHQYILAPNSYELKYKLQLKGLSSQLIGDQWVLQWNKSMKKLEKDLLQNRRKSTINYYTSEGDFDGLSESSDSEEVEELNMPVNWIALKQNFFTSALIAENGISKAKIRTTVPTESTDILKHAFAEMSLPLEALTNGGTELTYFFGPNNYKLLSGVSEGFEKNIYLGWFPVSVVNKYVIINVFHILEQYISNYGLIILILVLIIKLALSPLSYKSYVSMAKMKVLQPEIELLKEKHKDDMTKVQQEQMQLFRKVGVNPLSGCVPMLLQMPILFAMFYFFPSSIELRQESFLWADDLSSYDSILSLPFEIPFYGDHVSLFTILMTATTILTMRFQSNPSAMQGPAKTMMMIMPLMFMFVLNSFAAALTYYYFVANLITFGQQLVIRRMIDEDKIKKILEENKKRNANKKKSGFQLRLEEAMKASKEKAAKPKGKK